MLTIIVPVYNEKKTIRAILKKVSNLKNLRKQIIIVDDGSTDGTTEILKNEYFNKKKKYKVIFHKINQGKGAAIKSAQKFIKQKYVAIQDADLEYNPSDLQKIFNFIIDNKYDVVYGSRVLNKNKFQNTRNFTHFVRIWGNIFLTKVSNLINNQDLSDAHTCYKVFRSRIFKKIKLKEKGFAFCPEITTKISKRKYLIKEIPISYNGRSYTQGKKITSLDGLIALYSLIRYRLFD
jgi:glycosyltransferase involved in cell wall biosynthesis